MGVKRRAVLLLAAIMLLSSVALGSDTKISTEVPSEHTITIICPDGGALRIGGVTYRGTNKIKVARFSRLTVTAAPDDGFELGAFTSDSPGGITISGDSATIGRVYRDASLSVTFKSAPSAPEQPDTPETPTTPITGAEGEDWKRLYDDYLGVPGDDAQDGSPLDESDAQMLVILYDKDYAPDHYQLVLDTYTDEDLIAALPEDLPEAEREQLIVLIKAALPNTARVVAQPDMRDLGDGEFEIVTDENGEPVYSHRNMLISGAQLNKLEGKAIEMIAVENDMLDVKLALAELHEGNIAKLLVMMYTQGEFMPDGFDAETLDALPEVSTWLSELPPGEAPALTYAMFANAMLEVRLTPVNRDELLAADRELMDLGHMTEAERNELDLLTAASPAYRAQVFITANGVEANITPLLSTLNVSLSADALLEAEEAILLQTGVPENEVRERARETLLAHIALAAIQSGGDVHAEDYAPGMYTTLLDTELVSSISSDEAAMRLLIDMLQEQYEVQIIDGIVLASRSLETRSAALDETGVTLVGAETRYRLAANTTVHGLYLAVEYEKAE